MTEMVIQPYWQRKAAFDGVPNVTQKLTWQTSGMDERTLASG